MQAQENRTSSVDNDRHPSAHDESDPSRWYSGLFRQKIGLGEKVSYETLLDRMTLPSQIELRARCSEASDLSGLIFQMQITAGSKNPYRILFPKTTRDGRSVLTASDVLGQFTDHWEMALMDYNGILDDAIDIVTVRLFDPSSVRDHYTDLLAWPLLTHERTRWDSRQQFLDYLLSCRNEQFTFTGISVRLPESALIYLPLDRAVVDTSAN